MTKREVSKLKKLIISACLLGEKCRYDGESKPCDAINELKKKFLLLPVCPECMGGLSTPRPPAEIQADGRVVNREGSDVTAAYHRGAESVLALARREGCTLALLKEKSPSCGKGKIYDGSFTGTLTDGNGICADLLMQNGIKVFGESEIGALQSFDS